MKTLIYLSFFLSIAKSGILISLGLILYNHLETLVAFIVRKSVPDQLIDKTNYKAFINIIKWVGILVIIIAIIIIISAVVTLKSSLNPPTSTIGFKSIEEALRQIQ